MPGRPCNHPHLPACRTLEWEHCQDRLANYMRQLTDPTNLSPTDYLQDLAEVQKYCNHPTL